MAALLLGYSLWIEGGEIMNTDAGDEIARYLAEVAWNEPGQLPWAMVDLMQYGVMVALMNSLWCEIASMLEEWEDSLNELIQGVNPCT